MPCLHHSHHAAARCAAHVRLCHRVPPGAAVHLPQGTMCWLLPTPLPARQWWRSMPLPWASGEVGPWGMHSSSCLPIVPRQLVGLHVPCMCDEGLGALVLARLWPAMEPGGPAAASDTSLLGMLLFLP